MTSRLKKGWAAPTTNLVPGDVGLALEKLGVEVERIEDGEHWALCPAHEERTGKRDRHSSWSVNEDMGWHHCFSCGWRGSFSHLVSYLQDTTLEAAAAWVQGQGALVAARAVVNRMEARKDAKPDTTKVINEASLALYVPPPAQALASRNLTAEAAAAYGVLWDPKRDMWITPVRDPDRHHLLGWQEKNKRHFKNQPYGLKKSATLFGLDAFTDGEPAILVESPLDCVRIHAAGITGAVSSFGAIVSVAQLELVLDRTDHLIVALDNDEAGDKACREIHKHWARRFDRLTFFSYEHADKCKDPGDMSDEQIRQGITDAISSISVVF